MHKADKQKQSKIFAGISIDPQDRNMDIFNTYVLNTHDSPRSACRGSHF